jgi:indole-3-glycerol phosphate synthase
MANILDEILTYKRDVEVPARKRAEPLSALRARAEAITEHPRDFGAALRRADGCVALIAEVKRASPSRGIFVPGTFDPVHFGRIYADNGAAAISVLTDEPYFKGALSYMTAVRDAVQIPVLRKDFVVDAYQIFEARIARADAILLIVAALSDEELRDLYATAGSLGLAALVEVHDAHETERATALGARIIGVNNRDLRTFKTDLATTGMCAEALSGYSCTLVSESGIFTPSHVRQAARYGAHAILVGESLITSNDVARSTASLSSISVD